MILLSLSQAFNILLDKFLIIKFANSYTLSYAIVLSYTLILVFEFNKYFINKIDYEIAKMV